MKDIDTKCPNCGGRLLLSDDKNNKICPYCDSKFSLTDDELDLVDDISLQLQQLRPNYLEIVRALCLAHHPIDSYIYIADSLKEFSIFTKAQKHLQIPPDDDAFMIYDGTVFGSCKIGFALCTSGFYYRDDEKQRGMIPYDDFKKRNILIANDSIYIEHIVFHCGKDAALELMQFLNKIQTNI